MTIGQHFRPLERSLVIINKYIFEIALKTGSKDKDRCSFIGAGSGVYHDSHPDSPILLMKLVDSWDIGLLKLRSRRRKTSPFLNHQLL